MRELEMAVIDALRRGGPACAAEVALRINPVLDGHSVANQLRDLSRAGTVVRHEGANCGHSHPRRPVAVWELRRQP